MLCKKFSCSRDNFSLLLRPPSRSGAFRSQRLMASSTSSWVAVEYFLFWRTTTENIKHWECLYYVTLNVLYMTTKKRKTHYTFIYKDKIIKLYN